MISSKNFDFDNGVLKEHSDTENYTLDSKCHKGPKLFVFNSFHTSLTTKAKASQTRATSHENIKYEEENFGKFKVTSK